MYRNTKKHYQTAFRESVLALRSGHQDGLMVTDDHTQANRIMSIEELVHGIIRLKTPLYVLGEDNGLVDAERPIHHALQLLANYRTINTINARFPIHDFNPYVALFFRHIKVAIARIFLTKNGFVDAVQLDDFVGSLATNPLAWIDLFDMDVYRYYFGDSAWVKRAEILNGVVEGIRQDAKGSGFKSAIHNYRRLLRQNADSLTDYIDALFDRYSRLLVVRIDLGYRMKERWATSEETLRQEYAQAKEDFERFVNNQRANSLFKYKVGFVWKLEYGLAKGFHYHLIFFFDGSMVRHDVDLARRIGDYWNTIITEGRGLYFNCNAKKCGYKSLGIGRIKHDQLELIENLKQAAGYLVKADYYARIVSQGIGRTFGKGLVKKKKGKGGRPRKRSPVPA